MNQENKELIRQLKLLSENIDVLAKVTAITINKETFFKGKETKEEQIEALDELKLPDKIVAIVVGSTPESVQSLRSLRKAKAKKKPDIEQTIQKGETKQ